MSLRKHESADRMWWSLDMNGTMWKLGDHGDFEAAEETAEDLAGDIPVIWVADSVTAAQWREALRQ